MSNRDQRKHQKKGLLLLAGLSFVGILGIANLSSSRAPINYLKKDIINCNKSFNLGVYENLTASAGYGISGKKVTKIYSPIMKDSEGNYFYDLVGAVDMNRDGSFQEEELFKYRIKVCGKSVFLGIQDKVVEEIIDFKNVKTLEVAFDKLSK